MSIDLLIYICVYVCGCVIIFDLLFAVVARRSQRLLPRRRKIITSECSRLLAAGKNSGELRRLLRRWLTREGMLIALIDVIEGFEKSDAKMHRELCRHILAVIGDVADAYARKSAEYKALFAYAVFILHIARYDETPQKQESVYQLARFLMPQMTHGSVYVRQNTFRAIVSLGEAYPIYRAFICLNGKPELQNEKLLCDDMLLYQGSADDLIELLLRDFEDLDRKLQVAILNYCRFLPLSVDQTRFYMRIRGLLLNPGTDGEVLIAAIRYFDKRRWDQVYEDLLRLLDRGNGKGFNFSAVAATALQRYPSPRTEEALIRHMADADWYTRFNCAESLIALGVDYESIVLKSGDAYARDMLIYRSKVAKLKKRSRENA